MTRTHLLTTLPQAASASAGESDVWFVAYDIGDARRLRRVHRCMRRAGVALQYSGFAVTGDERRLQTSLDTLAGIIDAHVDDVRAYRLPVHCRVWRLGRQAWPEGVTLDTTGALQSLLSLTADELAPAEPECRDELPDNLDGARP